MRLGERERKGNRNVANEEESKKRKRKVRIGRVSKLERGTKEGEKGKRKRKGMIGGK